jgi:hypothetical protein
MESFTGKSKQKKKNSNRAKRELGHEYPTPEILGTMTGDN